MPLPPFFAAWKLNFKAARYGTGCTSRDESILYHQDGRIGQCSILLPPILPRLTR